MSISGKMKKALGRRDECWLRTREPHTLVLNEAHEQTTLNTVALLSLLSGLKRALSLQDHNWWWRPYPEPSSLLQQCRPLSFKQKCQAAGTFLMGTNRACTTFTWLCTTPTIVCHPSTKRAIRSTPRTATLRR